MPKAIRAAGAAAILVAAALCCLRGHGDRRRQGRGPDPGQRRAQPRDQGLGPMPHRGRGRGGADLLCTVTTRKGEKAKAVLRIITRTPTCTSSRCGSQVTDATRLIAPLRAASDGQAEWFVGTRGDVGTELERSSETQAVSQTTAAAAPTKHARLISWVEEIAELTQPDAIHWCDGSAEEYDRLAASWSRPGPSSGSPRRSARTPTWRCSDPGDVARVEDRTFICSRARGRRRPDQQLGRARRRCGRR